MITGHYIIGLRSALDTLPPFLYYELLVLPKFSLLLKDFSLNE